ncbi:MAG: protein kinase [Candidatus Margulisbacteria bacterium]|nr:protein kinase [Candidatus Margulisiibacteriota bacterium]MBU1021978.1 protein kinase [Candidatus Margulisiibacteriota bacterium]MBU1728956.1 protein kinase [Candidatus Margulisiibacteriota bacterium]MBU1954762.1 protein kinase [Candidatus Margulisiibacteriota bacterium]
MAANLVKINSASLFAPGVRRHQQMVGHTHHNCRVGDYTLKGVLGNGREGTKLYSAEHLPTGKLVALKICTLSLAPPIKRWNSYRVKRFLAEAHLLRKLNQAGVSGIVQHISHGAFRDKGILVMEVVDGISLLEECGLRQKFSPADTFMVGKQVCHTLLAMQELKIPHLDIKPGNIHLVDENKVILLDFGAAASEWAGLRQRGTAFGSPRYLSPEANDGLELDFRSDIFSLGLTLCTLLCGKAPPNFFLETEHSLYDRHFTTWFHPRALGIGTGLNILEKMLQKDPDKRHDDLTVLHRELSEAAEYYRATPQK